MIEHNMVQEQEHRQEHKQWHPKLLLLYWLSRAWGRLCALLVNVTEDV